MHIYIYLYIYCIILFQPNNDNSQEKILAGSLDLKTVVVIMKHVNELHSVKYLLEFTKDVIRIITKNYVHEVPVIR
jgi:hypothetical protein